MSAEHGCIACGARLLAFGRRLDYTYYRCSACGTIQLSPLPTVEELERAYRDDYAAADHIGSSAESSRKATRTLHAALVCALKEHCADGTVIDYGSGWGGLTILLQEAGYSVEAYDLSAEMVAHCQSEGLPMARGGIESIEGGQRDALVLASVFEHLRDPDEWLDQAKRLLKPGGLLVTTQPTALFASFAGGLVRFGLKTLPLPALHQIFCPPWHIALYSIEGLKSLAERHGFEWLETRPAPQQREPGLNGLLQRALETVNRIGWRLAGTKWPLLTGHIFVFRNSRERVSENAELDEAKELQLRSDNDG